MLTKLRLLSLAIALILAALPAHQPAIAQDEGPVYFPETGHWLVGDFQKTYQRASAPLLVYGYPLTDPYQDPTTGRLIQYFQRARFELHPEAPEELRVQLTPLGSYQYDPGPILKHPGSFQACKQFPETGFQVCYAFLDFYRANGGVGLFGYPISDFEVQDERIVQYFQRARFEWHPERPAGQRVVLTNLGARYFDMVGENPVRLAPNLANNIPQSILSLRVRAFPQEAATSSNGKQTVYVVVQDQNLQPVAQAQVWLIVLPPDGQEGRYILPVTDAHGLTEFTFNFEAGKPGEARMLLAARFNGLDGSTQTSFRVWW